MIKRKKKVRGSGVKSAKGGRHRGRIKEHHIWSMSVRFQVVLGFL